MACTSFHSYFYFHQSLRRIMVCRQHFAIGRLSINTQMTSQRENKHDDVIAQQKLTLAHK